MNDERRHLVETHRAIAAADVIRADLSTGAWGDTPALATVPLDDRDATRLGAFVREQVGPLLAAVDSGDRSIVRFDPEAAGESTADELAATDLARHDPPDALTALCAGEAFAPLEDPAPNETTRHVVACRVVVDGHILVGLQYRRGSPWTADGAFRVAASEDGYQAAVDPTLTVSTGFDLVCVDGIALVVEPAAFTPLVDRAGLAAVGGDAPTVLVVDDEPDAADLFATYLRDAYDVRVAYGGEAALEAIAPDVDVVLLDRMMPGVSGEAVLERIRERRLDCAVAMVTAVDPDVDVAAFGIDDYVTKPVDRETLCQTVERLLDVDDYDELERELSSLRVRRSVIEAELSTAALADSDRYERLERRIEQLTSRLETASGVESNVE